MRVLCIDASRNADYPDVELMIKENEVYNVLQSEKYVKSYRVLGFEVFPNGNRAHYLKIRFVPLSDIDETEIMQERQEYETVTQ